MDDLIRLQVDMTDNHFMLGTAALQFIYVPGHWQLLIRRNKELSFYCTIGYNVDDETKRIIGLLMGVQAGAKVRILQEGCQKQKGLECGLHVIAMAIAFILGFDPAHARFSRYGTI